MKLFLNFLLWISVSMLIFSTFYLNLINEDVYFLYSIVSILLLISIRLISKFFINIKKVNEFLKLTQKYLLLSSVFFIISLIFLKLKIYILLIPIILIASFSFSLSFLKVFGFGLRMISK